jgi:hypothetical protein
MERHRSLIIALHYFCAFHKKSKEHSTPFDKLFESFLREWFTSNGKLKLRVGKLIERERTLIIT